MFDGISVCDFVDKSQIFLAAFYAWTWVWFQLFRFITWFLHTLLKIMPNTLLGVFPSIGQVKIVHAINDKGEDMTNKFNCYKNLHWNSKYNSICVNDIPKYLGTTMLYVAYALKCDIPPNDDNDDKYVADLIKVVVIDISKKIIKRIDSSEGVLPFKIEPLCFGELEFE
jgi:hypothetical protein